MVRTDLETVRSTRNSCTADNSCHLFKIQRHFCAFLLHTYKGTFHNFITIIWLSLNLRPSPFFYSSAVWRQLAELWNRNSDETY